MFNQIPWLVVKLPISQKISCSVNFKFKVIF